MVVREWCRLEGGRRREGICNCEGEERAREGEGKGQRRVGYESLTFEEREEVVGKKENSREALKSSRLSNLHRCSTVISMSKDWILGRVGIRSSSGGERFVGDVIVEVAGILGMLVRRATVRGVSEGFEWEREGDVERTLISGWYGASSLWMSVR